MKTSVPLTSTSATKKQMDLARVLIGGKVASVMKKLDEYKKEKLVDTTGIDEFLQFLKVANDLQMEKFANSAPGKKVAANLRALAVAKTFPAIMKAIKAIKMPKSVKNLIEVTGKRVTKDGPKPTGKNNITPAIRKAVDGLVALYEKYPDNLKPALDRKVISGLPSYAKKFMKEDWNNILNEEGAISSMMKMIHRKDPAAYKKVFGLIESLLSSAKHSGAIEATTWQDFVEEFRRVNSGKFDVSTTKAKAFFKDIFGTVDVGFADDGQDQEGLSLSSPNLNGQMFLLPQTSTRAIQQKLRKKAPFVVYVDDMSDDGPFAGTPSPVGGTVRGFSSIQRAASYIKKITA